jgi:uncharacterized protein (DUF885 family)
MLCIRRILAATSLLILSAVSSEAQNSNPAWDKLVDAYFMQILYKFNPSTATSLGVHDYDSQLEDFSKSARDQQIEVLAQFEKRVAAFPAKSLSETDAADREMLLGNLRSSLLTLQVIRPWQKDPNSYPSAATNSVYVIMNRRFAPPDDRLRSVIAREQKIPALLLSARANLQNPPRISTEIALEQMPDIVRFFENDLPSAFNDASASVKADFAKSNGVVIAELKKYQAWLKDDLLPRSKGDFRIGAATFSKKLLYDEMVDTPLDKLLEIGTADLHKNQAEFSRIAKLVDPQKSPTEVLAILASRHPAPGELLQTFTNTFDGLISFIQTHRIITLPTDIRPKLQETPPFERATTTASMDTPGPFETHSTEAYFNVTLPGPNDSPEEVASLMAGFNVGTIISTAVHETYPGHYVQFLWTPRAPTKLRKVLGSNTNGEGWAHYCEQMMLDEGFAQPGTGAKDELESRLIRLGQLQDALLRDARFVVGIQMHRGAMTFDQAKEFFVKEGYQSPKIAEIETKRGITDPTYLYYTLGKLEILKLREDYKKKLGGDFSLLKFHDAFMAQGFPPIQIVRKALLGVDSPVL